MYNGGKYVDEDEAKSSFILHRWYTSPARLKQPIHACWKTASYFFQNPPVTLKMGQGEQK